MENQKANAFISFLMGKRHLLSLGLLWIGSIVGRGSTFLIYIILAREVGPATFGVFSSAMATIMIFSLFGGFGIPQVWLKLLGTEGWKGIRWVKPSLKFVFSTLVVILFSVFTITQLQPEDDQTNTLLLLFFFFLCGYIGVQLVSSKLQLEERYTFLTIWQFLPNITRLVIFFLCFYLVNWSLTLFDIGLIYAIVGLFFTLWSVKQLMMMSQGKVDLKGHKRPEGNIKEITPSLLEVAKEAWPFGFAGIFAFIYIQSDIVMIKYLSGSDQAGYYNVAFTILSAVMTIPMILFSKFLIPKYHRWSKYNKSHFYNTYKKGNFVMLLSGAGILICLLFFSKYIILLLFGDDYMPSVEYLRILAFSIPFSFLSYSYGATLLTGEHMILKVKLMGTVALLNIGINVVLIPIYGAVAAAFSTLLCNIILMFLYMYNSTNKVFSN